MFKTFTTKRDCKSMRNVSISEFVPKGTECVSLGKGYFMPLVTLQSLDTQDLGMWKALGLSLGNCRFRLEYHQDIDGNHFVNLVSIDRWKPRVSINGNKTGIQRMEIIHSWELEEPIHLTEDYVNIIDQQLREIRKDIYELPLFLRKKVTIDYGFSAKFQRCWDLDEEWLMEATQVWDEVEDFVDVEGPTLLDRICG